MHFVCVWVCGVCVCVWSVCVFVCVYSVCCVCGCVQVNPYVMGTKCPHKDGNIPKPLSVVGDHFFGPHEGEPCFINQTK